MTSEAEGAALLEWMNSFPEVAAFEVTNFIDFRDGKGIATLWNLCSNNKINVEDFKTPSSPTDWITMLKNLRAIDAVISPILIDKGLKETVNLTGLTKNAKEDELVKYVKPLVMISLSSPIKKDVIARIKQLSAPTQRVIKEIIKNAPKKKTAAPPPKAEPTKPEAPPPKVESQPAATPAVTESKPEPPAQPKKDDEPSLETKIRQNEIEISNYKQKISESEEKLREIQDQADKIYKKADQSQAELISQTERMLSGLVLENKQASSRIEELKVEVEKLEQQYTSMEKRIAARKETSTRTQSEMKAKKELLDSITFLEQSLTENSQLKDQQIKLSKAKVELTEVVADYEKRIAKIKDSLTTSVMLATKYGADDDSIKPAENENNENVTELANRITQLQVELAVVKDAVESGQTGIPEDLLTEHQELKRIITKLAKRKKQLEEETAQRQTLREDLQRVQKMMIDQREEVEVELAKLTDTINQKNIELSNWLSFSSSFDSWRNSSTFLSDLRHKYL